MPDDQMIEEVLAAELRALRDRGRKAVVVADILSMHHDLVHGLTRAVDYLDGREI